MYKRQAEELREALHIYTSNRGEGQLAYDVEDAVRVLQTKLDIIRGLFHGFDRSLWQTGTAAQRLALITAAQEFILAQPDGKARLLQHTREMSQAVALCIMHPVAQEHREEIAFYQAVRAALVKEAGDAEPQDGRGATPIDREAAIKQLVSRAITPGEVIDLFAAAGIKKPDVSILDDAFLASVRDMPHKNLAVELLRKLLDNEVRQRSKKNVVQSRSFAAMLDDAVRRYMSRTVQAEDIIEELIGLACEMREATARGEALGLTDDSEANIVSPFPFTFFGATSSDLRVGNNGGILFNATTGDIGITNAALPVATSALSILPFWDDIDADTGDVYWEVQGTTPNRMLIVEWYNRPHFSNVGSATFEMILYETTNAIKFQYADVDFGNASYNNGASATVGINKDATTACLLYTSPSPRD